MNKFTSVLLDFEQREMILNGKFNAKEFVIVVGQREYGEMMATVRESSATPMRSSGDGEFGGFVVKKLDVDSAFSIMSVDVFNTIILDTKIEMVRGLSRLNLLMELR